MDALDCEEGREGRKAFETGQVVLESGSARQHDVEGGRLSGPLPSTSQTQLGPIPYCSLQPLVPRPSPPCIQTRGTRPLRAQGLSGMRLVFLR